MINSISNNTSLNTESSDFIISMFMEPWTGRNTDNWMWKGKALALLNCIITALVFLRDNEELSLNVGTIREFMNLKNIIALGSEKEYPNMPKIMRLRVRAYLTSLPGFVESKGVNQAQTTLDHHGYLVMNFACTNDI